MTWYELETTIISYSEWLSLDTVHFGCDCGCGGDSYSEEEWDEIEEEGSRALEKLKSIGITHLPYDS